MPDICSFETCDRKAHCRGLCSGHYTQQHAGKALVPLRERHDECSFPECDRPHYAKGLCNSHWQQSKKGRELTPIAIPLQDCAFPDCPRPLASAQWCQGHWKQLRRGEEARDLESRTPQSGTECIVPSCSSEAKQRSLCGRHAHIKKKFNLSDDYIIELYAVEICAICGTEDPGARGFHVDHDHACCPGASSCGNCVRGLLCRACNFGLGNFRDNTRSLLAAIDYLGAAA